eukprot:Skav206179  [mRNA]  locus=scaffold1844:15904:35533:- [translate_table: standard]
MAGQAMRSSRGKASPILTSLVCGFLMYFGVPMAFSLAGRPATTSPNRRPFHLARRAETATEPAATETDGEEFEFQAEVGRVMDIIINSLYSNKDRPNWLLGGGQGASREAGRNGNCVNMQCNRDRDQDNGVGMLKEELKENLGRIARDADVSLIGQFGVGFYSAFLVANQVLTGSQQHTVPDVIGKTAAVDQQKTMHLHIDVLVPIWLRNPDVVNQSEYTEFYKTTFKAFDEPMTVTHFKVEGGADSDECPPGQIEFRALVFIPSTMPFELTRDMFSPEGRAMRLYVKRVFINDKFEEGMDLVPRWLTFVRGVVDSEDLPLNVGREILQKSRAAAVTAQYGQVQLPGTLKIIRKRVVRKVLDTIDDAWDNAQWSPGYGKYFKVGLVEDLDYKDELKRFVRFWSSKSGDNQTSLDEYISRMKDARMMVSIRSLQDGQDKIYFVTGEGKRAAEIAPAMEKMRLKDELEDTIKARDPGRCHNPGGHMWHQQFMCGTGPAFPQWIAVDTDTSNLFKLLQLFTRSMEATTEIPIFQVCVAQLWHVLAVLPPPVALREPS